MAMRVVSLVIKVDQGLVVFEYRLCPLQSHWHSTLIKNRHGLPLFALLVGAKV